MAGVCRTCMNDSKMYFPIFDEVFLDAMVFEILNDMCQLDITMGDELPEYLCHNCCDKLFEFQRFKLRAHEVRASLQCLKEHGRYLDSSSPCGSSTSEIEWSEVTIKQTPYEDTSNEISETDEYVEEESDDSLPATDSAGNTSLQEKYKTELLLNDSDSDDVVILENYPPKVTNLPVSINVGDVESEEADKKKESSSSLEGLLKIASREKLFSKEVLEENLSATETEYEPKERTVEKGNKLPEQENDEEIDVVSWTVEDNVKTTPTSSLFATPFSSNRKKTVSDYITLPVSISGSGDGNKRMIESLKVECGETSALLVHSEKEIDLSKGEKSNAENSEKPDCVRELVLISPPSHQGQDSCISSSFQEVGNRPKRNLRNVKDDDFVYFPKEVAPVKRLSHKFLEKQRRLDMRTYFENLRILVPTLSQKVNVSKVVILQEALKLCLQLIEQEKELLKSVRILKTKQLDLMAKIFELQKNR